MKTTDLNKILKYFTMYSDTGDKYYSHNEHDFYILVTQENKVYQLNTDHEIWGIQLRTLEEFKIRFKSFKGDDFDNITI